VTDWLSNSYSHAVRLFGQLFLVLWNCNYKFIWEADFFNHAVQAVTLKRKWIINNVKQSCFQANCFIKPRPHQQQCRSNKQQCCQLLRQCCFVAGVDRAKLHDFMLNVLCCSPYSSVIVTFWRWWVISRFIFQMSNHAQFVYFKINIFVKSIG